MHHFGSGVQPSLFVDISTAADFQFGVRLDGMCTRTRGNPTEMHMCALMMTRE